MRGLKRGFGALVSAALSAPAQAPPHWQWQPIPAARATVFAVLWQHGYDDDAPHECGAAAALAASRLERARRVVTTVTASGVQVTGDATVAFVLVPASAAADGVAFCGALLDDSLAVDDDLLVAATAHAALAADDAEWLYPGPVLASRARRDLLDGPAARAVAGSATALQTLTPARVRELLRAPVEVLASGVGCVPDAVRQAAEQLTAPVPASRVRRALEASRPPPAAVDLRPHARVDGPFAAIAFVVPTAVDRAALAVGIEVARARAARTLRLRGGEAKAQAPLVAWSWLRGEPLVVFCRRGANGADPGQPLAELERLIGDLLTRVPGADECDVAVRTLRSELGLAPPTAAADGAALPGWAVAALLRRHRGIDGADLAGVTAAAAHAAVRATCDPARACRAGLVPTVAAGSR